jgi:hypothetical protein
MLSLQPAVDLPVPYPELHKRYFFSLVKNLYAVGNMP